MECSPLILTGRTSLGQAAALLQRCDLAVGNDSGLPHYAFAVGTPLVCIMGPSTLRSGPRSDRATTLVKPCEFRHCRPSDRCKRGEGRPCLEEVSVEEAVAASQDLLARTFRPRNR